MSTKTIAMGAAFLVLGSLASTAWAGPTVSFAPASAMQKARAFFTANELPGGNILVAGGYDGSCQCAPNFADSEIYNPNTNKWTSTAPMNSARAAAVSLRVGKDVMVIGGFDENFAVLSSAEIYHPDTGSWSLTAPMNHARAEDFTAVLLEKGRVLVAGGTGSNGVRSIRQAEIYDEATNTWTPTGRMNVGRGEFASIALQDGRILVAGGEATDGSAIASAEIYNPLTGRWKLTGGMSVARNDLQAALLPDGRVLVAGGGTGSEENPRLTSAEIFDPHTGLWTPTGDMTVPRSEAEHATVRLTGFVLVPGGLTAPHTNVGTTDLYDIRTGNWEAAGPMSEPRSGHAAVKMGNGSVLVMGGLDDGPAAASSADIGQLR